MQGSPLHAWVDESINVHAGVYVLAAVIAPADAGLESIRDSMRLHSRRHGSRVHWRNELDRTKLRLVGTLGSLELRSVVVVAKQMPSWKQERARRKCLEQLLYRLARAGVSHVWVETRDTPLNARDVKMVNILRIRKIIPMEMRLDHARPAAEPMLWLPDVVAGAVSADRGGDTRFRAVLDRLIDEFEVTL